MLPVVTRCDQLLILTQKNYEQDCPHFNFDAQKFNFVRTTIKFGCSHEVPNLDVLTKFQILLFISVEGWMLIITCDLSQMCDQVT